MKKTAVSIAALSGLAWSVGAFAETPGGTRVFLPEPPAFTEVDTDGDGMITQAEFLAFIEERRSRAIPPEAVERHRAVGFEQADVNGDGFLSREEFDDMPRRIHMKMRMRDPKEFFERGDTDRDGVLNEQEFETLVGSLHRLRRHAEDFDEQEQP